MRTLSGTLILKLILLLATGWSILGSSPAAASVQAILAQTIEVESIIGNWLMEVEAEKALDAAQAEMTQDMQKASKKKDSKSY